MPISRRRFLAGAAGAGAVAALGGVGVDHLVRGHGSGAGAGGRVDPGKGVVVLITLYGGNDGLNTVVPVSDATYRGQRGPLALPEDKVLPIGEGLALHPSLTGVKALWDDHRLAIVRGVGYPSPVRSHFRSMDIWQSAVPDAVSQTGWLGRWLDATGKDPLRAISTAPTLPLLLLGSKTAGASILPGNGALPLPGPVAGAYKTLVQVPSGSGASPLGGLAVRIDEVGSDLLTVAAALQKAAAPAVGSSTSTSEPSTTAPGSLDNGGIVGSQGAPIGRGRKAAAGTLAEQMQTVARLVRAGLPTRVYAAQLGGFDTHVNELDTHARLLTELDGGLTALFDALGDDPRAGQVVAVVYSEFGRRVAANASGGTDHGTAAPVLVAGRGVKGGFHGDEPSLTDLDAGDLKAGVDFRSVYATLLGHVLGVDPDVSLGSNHPPLLDFV